MRVLVRSLGSGQTEAIIVIVQNTIQCDAITIIITFIDAKLVLIVVERASSVIFEELVLSAEFAVTYEENNERDDQTHERDDDTHHNANGDAHLEAALGL